MNRRQFLARSAKAGAAIAVAGAAGFWFHDTQGPDRPGDHHSDLRLPDFSIEDLEAKMSVVRGQDRVGALRLALKSIGGIEAFIKKGDHVLLKVNAAFASPAMLSATTHPAIVAELTTLCYKAGAASVVVTDNPINDPASCFNLTGIAEAARSAGANVILPRTELFKSLTVPQAKLIRNQAGPLRTVGRYHQTYRCNTGQGSPPQRCIHGHEKLVRASGGRRNIFHQDINTIIMELAMMVNPSLVILDGTMTMMTNGPTGGSLSDLKQTNTMIVGTDQVAVDAFGATLLDKTFKDLPFIGMAEAAGLGTADYRSLNPVMATV